VQFVLLLKAHYTGCSLLPAVFNNYSIDYSVSATGGNVPFCGDKQPVMTGAKKPLREGLFRRQSIAVEIHDTPASISLSRKKYADRRRCKKELGK
jgi:hypothetical protein